MYVRVGRASGAGQGEAGLRFPLKTTASPGTVMGAWPRRSLVDETLGPHQRPGSSTDPCAFGCRHWRPERPGRDDAPEHVPCGACEMQRTGHRQHPDPTGTGRAVARGEIASPRGLASPFRHQAPGPLAVETSPG